jgi:hypothetical protein
LYANLTGQEIKLYVGAAGNIATFSSTGFTSVLRIQANYANPLIQWYDTAGTANNRRYDFQATGQQLLGRLVNDADSAAANWLEVSRALNVATTINLRSTTLNAYAECLFYKSSTGGSIQVVNEGADSYNVIHSRNNANNAYLNLVLRVYDTFQVDAQNTGSPVLSMSGATECVRLRNDSAYISFYNSANSQRTGYVQGVNGSSLVVAAENGAEMVFNVGGTTRAIVTTAGVLRVASLAGAGTRTVVADASGNLSAP